MASDRQEASLAKEIDMPAGRRLTDTEGIGDESDTDAELHRIGRFLSPEPVSRRLEKPEDVEALLAGHRADLG
ncbi:hypothetical protein [Fulvimarina endophytica]|uniref:hypothetical protein n=1 Tax=Fulvimarina endophytica TaxID=2293836 RepID=UPI002680786A